MIATVTADALLEFFVGQVFDQLREDGTAIVHPGIVAMLRWILISNRSRSRRESTFAVAMHYGLTAKLSPDSSDMDIRMKRAVLENDHHARTSRRNHRRHHGQRSGGLFQLRRDGVHF